MPALDAGASTRPAAASTRRRRIPPLVWRRLPWWGELAIIVVGYVIYSFSRVAAPTKERDAFFHSSQVYDLERLLRIDIERPINQVVTAWGFLGDSFGYYYGTLHFVVTPAVLIWLFLRRPKAYPRLRSAIIIATGAALVVYWTWPLAPPRFALAGMTDTLVDRQIMNADDPSGVTSMVNLYAAMPSLHVAWAVWAALAVYATTQTRWRKLVWFYPLATTLVVMGTANHYLLDAVGGIAVVMIGLYLTRPVLIRMKPTPPVESIVTNKPAAVGGTGGRDTTREGAISSSTKPADGGIIDVRRSSAPLPPTDR